MFFRAKRKIVRVPMAHNKKRQGQDATPANHQKTRNPTPTPTEKGAHQTTRHFLTLCVSDTTLLRQCIANKHCLAVHLVNTTSATTLRAPAGNAASASMASYVPTGKLLTLRPQAASPQPRRGPCIWGREVYSSTRSRGAESEVSCCFVLSLESQKN